MIMKKDIHRLFTILLAFFMSMACSEAFAYDIAVKNEDGVTIYYNYISDGLELAVTHDAYIEVLSYGTRERYGQFYSGVVKIPSSVTYMNRNRKVTAIEDSVFWQCSSLSSVTIPNSVTNIGDGAFQNCTSLTSVTIPNSVTSIGDRAFEGCTNLSKVNISSLSTWCNISFGNQYSNPLVYAHSLSLNDFIVEELIIPENVTTIGSFAFFGCTSLTSVTIPNSVTSIGGRAFEGCTNLSKVNISNLSTWCNISFGNEYSNPLVYAHSIYLNDALVKKLIVPENVAIIGSFAFFGCTSLTSVSIPNSVTSIGSRAFEGCSGLNTVTIPSSVTSIGWKTFNGCTNLYRVYISDISSWCNISFDSGISNPHRLYLNNIIVKDLIIPEDVATIGSFAFSNCIGLASVTIGNSVTSIGGNAFSNCTDLTSITIPNSMTSIEGEAFNGCSKLREVNINCKQISSWFSNNSSLKNVSFGKEVETINADAFKGCTGLTTLSFEYPISIGNSAFCDSNIETIICNSNIHPKAFNESVFNQNTYYNASLLVPYQLKNQYKGTNGWKKFIFISEMVDENELIKFNCFLDGTAEVIGAVSGRAFSGHLDIPMFVIISSKYYIVTSIGNSAFGDYSSLTSVNIPSSVESIGDLSFFRCSSLASVNIPNSVTSIGRSAFSGCSSLTSVNIPSSVTSIGDFAFSGCSELKSIVVSSDNTVYDSRNNCNAIIETVSNTLIRGCNNTVIPNSVTSIGGYAFSGCSGLTSITIPNGVTSIGGYAFSGCSGLTSITIPNGVTSPDHHRHPQQRDEHRV